MRKKKPARNTRQVIHKHLRGIPAYDKTRKYLEQDKWVRDLLTDNKMQQACELAEK